MPGARPPNLRMGDRTELLVQFFLHTIAFTTPVPRQEDVGHDFLCVLTEPHDNLLWTGPSFTVQVKSKSDPLVFEKDYEVAWIKELENPYFVAVGDKKELRVTLHSTWQRMNAILYRAVPRIEFKLSSPPPGQDSVVTAPDSSAQTVYLGEPIISATLPEVMDRSYAEKLRRVLKQWVKIDRQNIACNQADIHWIVGPTSYTTNEAPPAEPVLLSFFWNPKNLSACARNFGRAATALRLTLTFGPSSAPFDSKQIEALDSAIKQWSSCLDPAAKTALAEHLGNTFD